jgi:hypothetical protein
VIYLLSIVFVARYFKNKLLFVLWEFVLQLNFLLFPRRFYEEIMTFEKSKAHCDLKWGSGGYLKKVKTDNGRQVIAKLKLLLDLTQIISS